MRFYWSERLKDINLFENLDHSIVVDNKQECSRYGCIYPKSYIPLLA